MTAKLPSRRRVGRLRARLLAWYEAERRDLPWRRRADPYAVLVSEVMLQQTQASRVAERFERFMARYPTVDALAAAAEAEVLAEWSGLGYYRRAIALRRAAAVVVRGGWPREVDGLARLPGVGPYTARAIASLAYGVPVGVVDTNVRRWLLRRFDVTDRPPSLQAVADALAAPGTGDQIPAWTHATMEFGAAICRARAPRCDVCPIAAGCPSRGTPPRIRVARQPALAGSDRAYRGALLQALAAEHGHAAEAAGLRRRIAPTVDDGRWEHILVGLARDGLAHSSGPMLRLGAATIGE